MHILPRRNKEELKGTWLFIRDIAENAVDIKDSFTTYNLNKYNNWKYTSYQNTFGYIVQFDKPQEELFLFLIKYRNFIIVNDK